MTTFESFCCDCNCSNVFCLYILFVSPYCHSSHHFFYEHEECFHRTEYVVPGTIRFVLRMMKIPYEKRNRSIPHSIPLKPNKQYQEMNCLLSNLFLLYLLTLLIAACCLLVLRYFPFSTKKKHKKRARTFTT